MNAIRPTCPSVRHREVTLDFDTFKVSTHNPREMESGDPTIKLIIAECNNCDSTLGFELQKGDNS